MDLLSFEFFALATTAALLGVGDEAAQGKPLILAIERMDAQQAYYRQQPDHPHGNAF